MAPAIKEVKRQDVKFARGGEDSRKARGNGATMPAGTAGVQVR